VNITVNGREIEVKAGELLIDAAERRVSTSHVSATTRAWSGGMCRMCLVEVEGPRGANAATRVLPARQRGMSVCTNSEKVKKAKTACSSSCSRTTPRLPGL